jgi:hypothetical protein
VYLCAPFGFMIGLGVFAHNKKSNLHSIGQHRRLIVPCFLFALFLVGNVVPQTILAQETQRNIAAIRTVDAIKIDGYLNEAAWETAPKADQFIQQSPYNGAAPSLPTDVRFLFDNSGLYIGAMMHDPHPDSILTQLGLRDATNLNADYFSFVLSPFNEGLNGFGFTVWASNVQSDFKITEEDYTHTDYSWDGVWLSEARIASDGWIVEMKIPWSALRFPKSDIQEWGMNCTRSIRRYREESTWNFIDAKIRGTLNQEGLLVGLDGIKPPLRLSLTPYLSGYVEKNPDYKDWQFSYNYGADLKYGINQSFTLDMTIIPDFGQTPPDDKIYNLTPYEIKYSEKRQFFTEGTELFDKGGIFYTRRVGSTPIGYETVYDEVDSNEVVEKNPANTRLINATKISGRTNHGLGIGVFNGMSANTWATIEDTVTGETRRFLTQGFTNYNMLVLDQALKNNSYFSLVNTNLYRADIGYSANVSGVDFRFANKPYTHAVSGNLFVSQKYYAHKKPGFGYAAYWTAGKISGNFLYSYYQVIQDNAYDPNDMGFNTRNNKFNNTIELAYNIYDPFWKVLNWYNDLTISYNSLYTNLEYTSMEISFSTRTTTLKHLTLGADLDIIPDGMDYYEPRVEGWKYSTPGYLFNGYYLSSDYRKPLAIDVRLGYAYASRYKTSYGELQIRPRFRPNDRLLFIYTFYTEKTNNDAGYVMDSLDTSGNEVILFGRRDVHTITNILQANYMFSSEISLNLRVRHYWLWANYLSYYKLRPDGFLNPVDYSGDHDVDYNSFTVDLSFIWDFAPGSQISFVWKNSIYTNDNQIDYNFFRNLENTILSPATNSFSVRILYYLDAQMFKKRQVNK